ENIKKSLGGMVGGGPGGRLPPAGGPSADLAAKGEATVQSALASLSPGIEAGVKEINRLSDETEAKMEKSHLPAAVDKVNALKQAVASGASKEVLAEAVLAAAEAAASTWKDAKDILEGLLEQIPSIVMWAMKDIKAHALWSMS